MQQQAKIQANDIKRVSHCSAIGLPKTRGGKMKVTSIMLLKTHGEKLSDYRLSIMLMKNKPVITRSPLC